MESAREHIDELTALFLSEGDASADSKEPSTADSAAPPKAETSPPRVTVALSGHLPVMRNFWVIQYADSVAAEHGPIGLVQLQGGRCQIEVLRPDEQTKRVFQQIQLFDVGEAIGQLSTRVDRWIVCVDERDAAAGIRAGADEVVVLTSTDRPAMLEAYRLVKIAVGKVSDPDSLGLGLVLVGSDEERSAIVSSRLDEVAMEHLGRRLPVRGVVQRLDVVGEMAKQVFDESARASVEEVVEAIVETASVVEARRSREEPVLEALDPWTLDEETPCLRIAGSDPSPMEELVEPMEPVEPPAFTMEPKVFPRAEERIRRRPSEVRVPPAPAVSDSDPIFDGEDHARPLDEGRDEHGNAEVRGADRSLVDLFEELEPVDWVIPGIEGVEFARDRGGRLHLLAMADQEPKLYRATHWLRGQRASLVRATGVLPDSVDAPSMHVLTRAAPEVADLHRNGMHLHLLVDHDGRDLLLPLNDETNRRMPD